MPACPRLAVFKQVITFWGDEGLCRAVKGCRHCGRQIEVQDNDCSDGSVSIIRFFFCSGLWVRSRFLFSVVIPRRWPLTKVTMLSCWMCEEKIIWERCITRFCFKALCPFCISYRNSITWVQYEHNSDKDWCSIYIAKSIICLYSVNHQM